MLKKRSTKLERKTFLVQCAHLDIIPLIFVDLVNHNFVTFSSNSFPQRVKKILSAVYPSQPPSLSCPHARFASSAKTSPEKNRLTVFFPVLSLDPSFKALMLIQFKFLSKRRKLDYRFRLDYQCCDVGRKWTTRSMFIPRDSDVSDLVHVLSTDRVGFPVVAYNLLQSYWEGLLFLSILVCFYICHVSRWFLGRKDSLNKKFILFILLLLKLLHLRI